MRFKSVIITVAVATVLSAQEQKAPTGYTDTPTIPGSKWRVHDDARPRPPVITPGTCSTEDMPGKPPSDAVVLFDGTSLAAWRTENGEPAKWKVENGYMEVAPGAGDIWTRQNFGDSQLHVEFRTPSPPKGDSQGRGNSGVLLYGIYELQQSYLCRWTGIGRLRSVTAAGQCLPPSWGMASLRHRLYQPTLQGRKSGRARLCHNLPQWSDHSESHPASWRHRAPHASKVGGS
jgi:Domain of Unknown Function (DUF1080)